MRAAGLRRAKSRSWKLLFDDLVGALLGWCFVRATGDASSGNGKSTAPLGALLNLKPLRDTLCRSLDVEITHDLCRELTPMSGRPLHYYLLFLARRSLNERRSITIRWWVPLPISSLPSLAHTLKSTRFPSTLTTSAVAHTS
jgi:hypothetical protein